MLADAHAYSFQCASASASSIEDFTMKHKILNYILAFMLAASAIVVMCLSIMAIATFICVYFIIYGFALMFYMSIVSIITPVWLANKFIAGDENIDHWLKDVTRDFFSLSFELLMSAKYMLCDLHAFVVKIKDSIMTKLRS
jgi:hypothetical protein